jgi:hypothetical protein
MVPMTIAILIAITLGDLLLSNRERIPNWPLVSRVVLGTFFAIAFLLGTAEGYFRWFHASTEGRLASNNWAARYWEDNSYGYRDHEWQPGTWDERETVLVLGDSIGAGWAIEDNEDRFGDVLQDHLGDDYAVINAALPGLSTMEQIDKLETFELLPNPDTVILQYTLNDIEGAALQVGLGPDFPPPPELAQRSHLADFIYTRDVNNVGFNDTFWAWQYAAYDNFAVWNAHDAELRYLADYTAEQDIRLIVVIFPNMVDPIGSVPYVDRVAQVFEGYPHVEVLKLFDDVAERGVAASIVSIRDSHPNAAFHRHVGDRLYELYFQ